MRDIAPNWRALSKIESSAAIRVWGTPHGLHRLVTTLGTTTITQAEYHLLTEQAIALADDDAA